MRKLLSWLLVLTLLVTALCIPAMAAETESGEAPSYVDTDLKVVNESFVVLTMTAMQPTTNGRITIAYDQNELALYDVEVTGLVTDTDDTDGVVTLGWADLKPIQTGEVVATVTFRATSMVTRDELVISVVDFNSIENQETILETYPIFFGYLDTDLVGSGIAAGGTAGDEWPFIDVDQDDWFYDAVAYVVENGYFQGTSANTFDPNGAMTRAMFVTVLGRMAGADVDHNTNAGFSDVVSGSYYAGYVAWASANGIVMGTSETTFSPNDYVTREQMAAFLYRYAKYAGMDVSASAAVMNSFADAGSVSSWAKDAMAWATSRGIINGTGKGLEPQASATRAQVAQIILNFETKA